MLYVQVIVSHRPKDREGSWSCELLRHKLCCSVSVQHRGIFCWHPRKAPLALLGVTLECVWCSLPVSLCAALAVVENPEPAGMWWGEAPLKIHAPEVPAGFLPGESIRNGLLCASVHSESQKNRSNFCSSRAVATPSCCNTHILKNYVFLKCCWVILQEGRGRVCSFGHQSVIPGFWDTWGALCFLATEVLPKFSAFLNSAQFGCWWAKEW